MEQNKTVDLEIIVCLDDRGRDDSDDADASLPVEVRLRVDDPQIQVDEPVTKANVEISNRIIGKSLTPELYGEALRDELFVDELRERYLELREGVERMGADLRIRLDVEAGSEVLHGLRWELLTDPKDGKPWWTSERVIFSRKLASPAKGGFRRRENRLEPLKAVIAVAAPSGLPEGMEVDYDREVGPVRDALQGLAEVQIEEIGSADQKLTLDLLVESIQAQGGVDILYLAAHGMMSRRGEPIVYLANKEGKVDSVPGQLLADRIAELTAAPRLVYLASCESAGKEKDTGFERLTAAQGSLAQRLVPAGVCAVVAMQGQIAVDANRELAPEFFQSLMDHGRADRALAVARRKIARDCPDAWMPVLYCGLKTGELWHQPEFAGEDDGGELMEGLREACKEGRLVPVVGPEVAEEGTGALSEVASWISRNFELDLPDGDRDDLLKVAQHLVDKKGREAAVKIVQDQWRKLILDRDKAVGGEASSLSSIFDAIVEKLLRKDKHHPFRKLADLGAYTYVDAGLCGALENGMVLSGRKPRSVFAPLRRTAEASPKSSPRLRKRSGTTVYHAFGSIDKPDSLVLTDQDLLDLAASQDGARSLKNAVTSTRANTILLAGFPLAGRRLRALLSMMLSGSGGPKAKSVVVLVDPVQYSGEEAEAAQRGLEKAYPRRGGGSPVKLFRGDLGDFLSELGDVRNQATGWWPLLWDLVDWLRKLGSGSRLPWAAAAGVAALAIAWGLLSRRDIEFPNPYAQVTPPMYLFLSQTLPGPQDGVCGSVLAECREIKEILRETGPPAPASDAGVPVVQFDEMRPDMRRGFQYALPENGRLDLEELGLCVRLDESETLKVWSGGPCSDDPPPDAATPNDPDRPGEVRLSRSPYTFLVNAVEENGEDAVVVRMLGSGGR